MTIGYPTSQDAIAGLVDEHKRIQDEHLWLAIYYAPSREPQDIFLFEVFDGFARTALIRIRSCSKWPMGPGRLFTLTQARIFAWW